MRLETQHSYISNCALWLWPSGMWCHIVWNTEKPAASIFRVSPEWLQKNTSTKTIITAMTISNISLQYHKTAHNYTITHLFLSWLCHWKHNCWSETEILGIWHCSVPLHFPASVTPIWLPATYSNNKNKYLMLQDYQWGRLYQAHSSSDLP